VDAAEAPKELVVMNLGRRRYGPVHELQETLVAQRKAGDIPDTLLFVEHEPVYTLGRSAKDEHVLMTAAELAQRGIDVMNIGRGGDVTYHGPGQLVGYPICSLAELGRGAVGYVSGLEKALLATLASYGIEGNTDPINRGAWVGMNKVAAIGVRIANKVTMHGFALNVTTDMSAYAGIVPCGLHSRGVTSMALLGVETTLADVAARFLEAFTVEFNYVRVRRSLPPKPGGGDPCGS